MRGFTHTTCFNSNFQFSVEVCDWYLEFIKNYIHLKLHLMHIFLFFQTCFSKVFRTLNQILVVQFTCTWIIIGYTWKLVRPPAAFQGVRSRMQLEGWRRTERQLKLALKGTASTARTDPECLCSHRTCRSPALTSPPAPARPPGAFLVVNMGVLDHHWFPPDSFDLQQVWRGSAK